MQQCYVVCTLLSLLLQFLVSSMQEKILLYTSYKSTKERLYKVFM